MAKTFGFDVIFNAIHGVPGENGELAAVLDLKKYPSNLAVKPFAAELTFNKRKPCLELVKNWDFCS